MEKEHTLIGIRESLQSPTSWVNEEREPDHLVAPPDIDYAKVLDALPLLVDSNHVLELQNPISSPTTSQNIKKVLFQAKQLGIADQVALHVRLTKADLDLAARVGATRVHAFGNGSLRANSVRRKQPNELALTARDALNRHAFSHLRLSLEQATETEHQIVKQFVDQLVLLNRDFPNTQIELGIPDTNGQATSDQYGTLIDFLAPTLRDSSIPLHLHLHNDKLNAQANLDSIRQLSQKYELNLTIEHTPAFAPGEGNGVLPHLDASDPIHCAFLDSVVMPQTIFSLSEAEKLQTHVAGIHTSDLKSYGEVTHLPSVQTGLYHIMGTNNIVHFSQETQPTKNDKSLAKSTALIARELAAQFGNLPHAYLLAVIQLAVTRPELIANVANKFGSPETWNDQSPAYLDPISGGLNEYLPLLR